MFTNRNDILHIICKKINKSPINLFFFLVLQKLSALSSSLARVVSSVEEEEAQLDQFPVEGV